jgi:hypothetical protein
LDLGPPGRGLIVTVTEAAKKLLVTRYRYITVWARCNELLRIIVDKTKSLLVTSKGGGGSRYPVPPAPLQEA